MSRKKIKNPLIKRIPKEIIGDWKKYADAAFDKATNSYIAAIKKGSSLNKDYSIRVKSEKNENPDFSLMLSVPSVMLHSIFLFLSTVT